jgi:hypothetical protein
MAKKKIPSRTIRSFSLIGRVGFVLLLSLGPWGCGKGSGTSQDISELGQQVGDLMAGVDESGGTSGSLALLDLESSRLFARRAPEELSPTLLEKLGQGFLPEAFAGVCSTSASFGSCTASGIGGTSARTRNLSGCTVGTRSFSGTITLSYSTADCSLTNVGDHVTREPAFTMTGRRGATLTVSKTGTLGQRLVRLSDSGGTRTFSLSNDGIRRVFTSSGGTLFDFTTTITSAVTVTGGSRAGRVMTGGVVQVLDNKTGVSCDFVPTAVTWVAGCNCPTSGSWAANCSDGSSRGVTLTGCGTATYTSGSDSEEMTFDRCSTAI